MLYKGRHFCDIPLDFIFDVVAGGKGVYSEEVFLEHLTNEQKAQVTITLTIDVIESILDLEDLYLGYYLLDFIGELRYGPHFAHVLRQLEDEVV